MHIVHLHVNVDVHNPAKTYTVIGQFSLDHSRSQEATLVSHAAGHIPSVPAIASATAAVKPTSQGCP